MRRSALVVSMAILLVSDAREVVQFFQATRIGLTATPKAYLKNINVEKLGQENPKALEARILRDL